MPHSSHTLFIDAPAGKLETILAEPVAASPRGIAIITHPHPLYGGTMNNKVVHTLFKSFLELGFITVKFNFRGVEQSEGTLNSGKDNGSDEVEDVLAVAEAASNQFAARFDTPPLMALAGFSFGGAIQAHAAQRLSPEILVMVAPAVKRLNAPSVAYPTARHGIKPISRVLIVHGDQDDVVPLESVLAWAAPQELPVVVVPGAEHFFHRRLHILQQIILDSCRP